MTDDILLKGKESRWEVTSLPGVSVSLESIIRDIVKRFMK